MTSLPRLENWDVTRRQFAPRRPDAGRDSPVDRVALTERLAFESICRRARA